MDKREDKTGAIIKLSLWLVFIIVIVIIAKVGGNKAPTDDKKDETNKEVNITYEEKLNKLNDNYNYVYDITVSDKIVKYIGTKNGSKESGKYITNEKETTFYKDKGYTYEVIDGGLNKIDSIYNEINEDYVNVSYIKELLKEKTFKINDKGIYEYNIDNVIINISVNEKDITNILIKSDNDIYDLKFSDIGNIKEVNY